MFCRQSLRNVPKNRSARAEPSFFPMNPFVFWTCDSGRELQHKSACTATSSTLYPKISFIQIARHSRSSLSGFDSGRSQHIEFCPILPFGIVANALTLLLDNLSRNSCILLSKGHTLEFGSDSPLSVPSRWSQFSAYKNTINHSYFAMQFAQKLSPSYGNRHKSVINSKSFA